MTAPPASSLYITPLELRSAPTGNDWLKSLNVSGQPMEDYNLLSICQVVSDEVDNICNKLVFNPTEKDYVLRASVNTETGNTRDRDTALIDEYGNLTFIATFRPIISVTSLTVIPIPGNGMMGGVPFVIPPNQIFWQGREVSAVGYFSGAVGWGWGSWGWGGGWSGYTEVPLRVALTYINGFPNTTLASDASAAATSLVMMDPTGILPGAELRIYDIPPERVVVASTYDGVSSTIPLAYPITYAHVAGVRVSELGADLQQACIWLAMDLIQSRAQQGVTAARQLPGFSGAGKAVVMGATDYYWKAEGLISKYILTP